MKVLELCEKCANAGKGKIRVININNFNDKAEFNDIDELKRTSIKTSKYQRGNLYRTQDLILENGNLY